MNRIKIIGMLWAALSACSANPDGYRIQGTVADAGDGIAVMTRFSGRKVTASDTVELRKGKFVFTGRLETPERVGIQLIPSGQTPVSMGFIAENSPVIRMTADWKDVEDGNGYRFIRKVKVEGSLNNQVAEEFSGVREEMLARPEFKEYADLRKRLEELHGKDSEAYEKLKEELKGLAERYGEAVRKRQLELIRQNGDVASVGECLRFLMANMPLEELEEVFGALSPRVQASPMTAEVREEIVARRRVQPGQPAPDFTGKGLDGSDIRFSEAVKGKYVILDFWASWCRPCRASMPHVKSLYEKYKGKGLAVFCVSDDDSNPDKWREAVEQDGTGDFFHVLRGLKIVDRKTFEMDKTNDISDKYAIHYLPTKYLIDDQFRIVGKFGDEELDAKLAEIFGK